MTPAEREEALERREANAALLAAKLEKDRVALESEISASAAASKAAASITKALRSDAAKKAKGLEDECAQWEAKLTRLKAEAGKATPEPPPARREDDSAAVGAARAQLVNERASLDAERAAFDSEVAETRGKHKAEAQSLAELRLKLGSIRNEIEGGVKAREAEVRKREVSIEAERAKLQASADSLIRAEVQQAEQRTLLESQLAALAAKEVMFEERNRQLQERLKNFAKA